MCSSCGIDVLQVFKQTLQRRNMPEAEWQVSLLSRLLDEPCMHVCICGRGGEELTVKGIVL